MRKILALFLCCILSGAHAQLNKGGHFFGLQTNVLVNDWYITRTTFNVGDEGEFGFSIVPTYGYVVKHNWIVGAEATFGIERDANSFHIAGQARTQNNIDVAIAPYTRYYVDISRNGQWKIFGRAAIEIIYNHSSQYYDWNIAINSRFRETDLRVIGALGGGAAWFGKRISIDASISNSALKLGVYKTIGR